MRMSESRTGRSGGSMGKCVSGGQGHVRSLAKLETNRACGAGRKREMVKSRPYILPHRSVIYQ